VNSKKDEDSSEVADKIVLEHDNNHEPNKPNLASNELQIRSIAPGKDLVILPGKVDQQLLPSPNQVSLDEIELENPQITALASPSSAVSAFVRSTLNRLIPGETWGEGEAGRANASWFLQSVDKFINRRKFESMTLQEALQGLKVSEMTWLSLPGDHKKMAKSDFEKRKQLLAEFVYYLFDSFVIPLIRSNFHATESNGSKNRLFYFRHDVWRQLTEPSILELKKSMFQDIGSKPAKTLQSGRSLGYSQIRMLPKKNDFRPIANLRKRPEYLHYGKRLLGKSVNSMLTPAFKVLNSEKVYRICVQASTG
jgi:telomerase reverse transcriptase